MQQTRFSVGDVLHPTQVGDDLEAETLYARPVAERAALNQ
jgi:hypothetical protein